MVNRKITSEELNEYFKPLIGLPVSRPWLGHGSPIFLDLGKVSTETHGNINFEKGDFGVQIDWDWRVEDKTEILFGSSDFRKYIENRLGSLRGVNVISMTVSGVIPEITITFSNGYILKSMSMCGGNPQWSVCVNDDNYVWWENGSYFFGDGAEEVLNTELKSINRSIATAERWNLPVLDKKENNCGDCEYYNWIQGNGPVLDHGVCTSETSDFDGRVVNFRFGCKSFASTKQ